MSNLLWNYEDPITELTKQVIPPRWIDPEISPSTVAAICKGGCSSGAYMPAVTYAEALDTMYHHGDTFEGVLQYLEDELGELPKPPDDISWSGLAVLYLSSAVEIWAQSVEEELTNILKAKETE